MHHLYRRHPVLWLIVGLTGLFPLKTGAMPVINEVMWAGSDLSSSDEWVEITCTESSDISGWKLSYVNSSSQEKTIITFATGTVLEAGEPIVVGRYHADSSRLLSDPGFVSSAVSLLNTGLNLKLKDASGLIIDEVNAGSGTPFAGSNPSGGAGRASMERIDPEASGSDESNWQTATVSLGFDEGANVFGTPGYPNSEALASSSSVSSDSSVSLAPRSPEGEVGSSASSSCSDSMIPQLIIQSGSPTGIGKVTINMQVIAVSGSLLHATCAFQFGDGTGSSSCNPPEKSYGIPGSYIAQSNVTNQCGNTLVLEQKVEVFDDYDDQNPLPHVYFDGSRLALSGAMPNAPATDKDKEWFEIKNLENREVNLSGWMIAIGTDSPRNYPIKAITSIPGNAASRLYQSETKLTLANTRGKIGLVNPDGVTVSTISWEEAEEGRVYKPDNFRHEELKGTVIEVIDGDTFKLALGSPSFRLVNEEKITVRLLGIDTPETVYPGKTVEPFGPEASAFLKDLVQGKEVLMLMDNEVWDAYGRLLAYVYLPDGRSVQRELLRAGLAEVYRKYDYSKKNDYLGDEGWAKNQKIGQWSVEWVTSTGTLALSEADSEEVTLIALRNGKSDRPYPKVTLTEVYPAPHPSPKGSAKSGAILDTEWIELHNPYDNKISLYRWGVTIGKKTSVLNKSLYIEPMGYLVLSAQTLGLRLPNAGGEIALRSPDGSYRQFIRYPKVSNGSSYLSETGSLMPCITKTPSPGAEGRCPVAVTSLTSGQKRKLANTLKYADSYMEDVRAAGEKGDENAMWREASSSNQAAIIFSFLAGLCSFGAVQVVFTYWRNRKIS